MKCIVCNNIIDDDSCFCKWCGNPVEDFPWVEEDGIEYSEVIPFMTFWRRHGEISVYKRINEDGELLSCILFKDERGQHTILNFNCWVGAATYLEVQACKRHMLVYHLLDGSFEVHGYQTDEHRPFIPVSLETLVLPKDEEEDYPF